MDIDVICECPLEKKEVRSAYRVTGVTDPRPLVCFYCTDCAELARMNFTGETATCTPLPDAAVSHAARMSDFDPLATLVDALPLSMPAGKRGALLASIADAIGRASGDVTAKIAVRPIDGVETPRVHVYLDGEEISAVRLTDLDARVSVE